MDRVNVIWFIYNYTETFEEVEEETSLLYVAKLLLFVLTKLRIEESPQQMCPASNHEIIVSSEFKCWSYKSSNPWVPINALLQSVGLADSLLKISFDTNQIKLSGYMKIRERFITAISSCLWSVQFNVKNKTFHHWFNSFYFIL